MHATEIEQTKEAVPVESQTPAPGEDEAELPAESLDSLITEVVAAPVAKLAKLIDELKDAKTHLESKHERVQSEVDRYLQLNRNTVESIKIITDAVTEWRSAGHPSE
jgi:hypothetical protein